jgi:hypothetical protein
LRAKSQAMLLKKVKVQSRFRAISSNIDEKKGKGKTVPEIRISGVWLRNLGFEEGASIKIVEKPDGILIVPAKK